MTINKKFLCLIVIFLFSGCAQLQSQFPKRPLLGTWQFEDSSLGSLTLTFKEDYTYAVDYNNDGEGDIIGQYSFFIGRIKMKDADARVKTDCYEAGLYDYVIEDNRIEFKKFADQCLPRKYILGYSFIRKNLEK